ncbi:MAG: 50S ribosomal protein L19 [Prosthecobacter sp.]|jgi:large subunit ribosomal protein L19
MSNIIDKIDAEQIKKDVSPFRIGDTVKVHTRVIEGDKERIQIFAGIIISHKGCGLNEAFTVRKISYGEGVERVFPVHSPKVAQIEVTKSGRVRRARLHYLRGRKGKQAITVKDVARVVAA